jgi:hypothetical protein
MLLASAFRPEQAMLEGSVTARLFHELFMHTSEHASTVVVSSSLSAINKRVVACRQLLGSERMLTRWPLCVAAFAHAWYLWYTGTTLLDSQQYKGVTIP